ncbi:PAS domain-containing sensor histidine kinase [Methanoculleus taiwanensis]|uniref:PAS domain-containing sensor histidine kinase n=1 Tax=Methanoculleus taiwanensis TaxID=1550565 RepID=UPI000FFEEB37|nr:PAS domain-containing sensor histidine kinase [Methanoculleus taiwanensis]
MQDQGHLSDTNASRLPRKEELLRVLEELYGGFAEAEETLSAIRRGEVDAFLVSTDEGEKIYTLKTAEHPYRVLIEQMREGAAILSTDGTVLYSNASFARLIRMPLEKVMGESIHAFIAPAGAGSFRRMMEAGDPSGSTGESTLQATGGGLVPVYLSLRLLPMDGMSVFSLVATDLTERKQAEETLQRAYDELEDRVEERTAELAQINARLQVEIEERIKVEDALRESEARERRRATELQAITEAVPAAIFIALDPECRSMFGSRYTYELLHLPPGSNLSKSAPEGERQAHFRTMKDGAEIPPEELPVQRAAATGRPVQQFEFDLVFNDGTTRHLLGNAVPLLDESGRSHGAVGAFIDITERKRAEEALRRRTEDLVRQSREVVAARDEANMYLDIMTHDVRNANNVSSMYAGLLVELAEGDLTAYAEKLRDSIDRSTGILRNVATIRRTQAEHDRLVPVNLDAIIKEEIGNFPGASIRYIDPAVEVLADNLLPMIFTNLIGNAIKYGEPGVEITIVVEEQGGEVLVSVEDTGPGVPDEVKKKLFTRFERGRAGGSGQGLGLFIVRMLVERYGGEVWIEDRIPGQPEQGAAFRFTLRKAGYRP